MSLPDLDKLTFYTPLPAFRNWKSGTFTVSVSGTLGSGLQTSFSNSTAFERGTALVRLYISQSVTPVDAFTDYTAGALLPSPPYGSVSSSPLVSVACSVAGDPSVTSINPNVTSTFTPSTLSYTFSFNNPYGGTLTFTSTVFTIRYVAFLPTPAYSPNT